MVRLGSPEGRRKEVVVTERKEGMEREMGKEKMTGE